MSPPPACISIAGFGEILQRPGGCLVSAGVREVSGYHPVGDRPATGFCVGLSCRSPGGGARVLIGWTLSEFCKSPLWYWLPKYCAWFSRSDHIRSIRSGPHRLGGVRFFFRDGRHTSGHGSESGRAARAVRGRCGRLRAALWRLRDALSGSTGNGFVSGALLPLVALRRFGVSQWFAMFRFRGDLPAVSHCRAMSRYGAVAVPTALSRPHTARDRGCGRCRQKRRSTGVWKNVAI